jgi:hypothetical protein
LKGQRRRKALPRFLKGTLVYFAVVFGAGFLLGTARVLIIVPLSGVRLAELVELPVMLLVTIVSAKWIVRRLSVNSGPHRLAMGSIAFALLLIAEFTLVLWLRGLTIKECLASLDPVTGTAYYLTLALFAVMPLIVSAARASLVMKRGGKVKDEEDVNGSQGTTREPGEIARRTQTDRLCRSG